MFIKSIRVKNLFNQYSYEYTFNELSVGFGINGIGKTTITRMVSFLFNTKNDFKSGYWCEIPFSEFTVTFNTDDYVSVFKDNQGNITISKTIELDPKNPDSVIKRFDYTNVHIYPDEFIEEQKKLISEIWESFFTDFGNAVTSINWEKSKSYCVFERNNEEIKMLSDGEDKLFKFVCLIVQAMHYQKDTTIIIDEPDTHLHIAWQSKLTDLIYDYLWHEKLPHAHIILWSHSPFMAAGREELLSEPHFVK